ncbi:hypothetical protein LX32DRAFT_670303 [Colletotrichum zoysiae]|uniref:HNH nuclease domain-containing protein n=1 Tax=Colletotrichum zoysiae TaxID=1216348 RepID=A0AAD9HTS3_9PEZI|nr:hypothetical protein LX32DRAFT_670303 [Colletotrichum zoysiae]
MKTARDLTPTEPSTAADWQLKNFVDFFDAVNGCGDDKERLSLMNENLHIPLGQPRERESVFLTDREEKLKILTYIAEQSFVQVKDDSPRKVDKGIISRFTWAAIWVTPLDTMKKWEATIKAGEPLDFRGMIMEVRHSLPRLVNFWRGKDANNPQKRPARKERPRQIALQRDQGQCVLLQTEDPEVSHIYPHASILNAPKCSQEIEALAKLWGRQIIDDFMAEMNMDNVDVPENMISFNCLIHYWMDQVKIAFEPVEEQSNAWQLALRFRILQDSRLRTEKGKKSEYDDSGLELNQDPMDILEDLQTSTKKPMQFYARNAQTGEVIRDGHLFYVRTDDPKARPLPSIRIMQVHYRMALMMRLAGAAEAEDDDDDDAPPDSRGDSVATTVSQSEMSQLDLDPHWDSD